MSTTSATVTDAIKRTRDVLALLEAIHRDGIYNAAGCHSGIEAYAKHTKTFTLAMISQLDVLMPIIKGTAKFADIWQEAQSGYDNEEGAYYQPSPYIAEWLSNAKSTQDSIIAAKDILEVIPRNITIVESLQKPDDMERLANEFEHSASLNAWDGGVQVSYAPPHWGDRDDHESTQRDMDNDKKSSLAQSEIGTRDNSGRYTAGMSHGRKQDECFWVKSKPSAANGWEMESNENHDYLTVLETDETDGTATTFGPKEHWGACADNTPTPKARSGGRYGSAVANDAWCDLETKDNGVTRQRHQSPNESLYDYWGLPNGHISKGGSIAAEDNQWSGDYVCKQQPAPIRKNMKSLRQRYLQSKDRV